MLLYGVPAALSADEDAGEDEEAAEEADDVIREMDKDKDVFFAT